MLSTLAILAAAALVGALHMSAPDHWLTLCVMARASNWSRAKLLGLGTAAAGGHVLASLLLGFAIVGAGLVLSPTLTGEIIFSTGLIMVAGGAAYSVRALWKKEGTPKVGQNADLSHGVTYFAVLGAALSPDLTVLPIFVLAIPQGLAFVVDAALVFAVASIATLAALVLVGSMGMEAFFARIPERYNDAMVGAVVALVGVYVLAFG